MHAPFQFCEEDHQAHWVLVNFPNPRLVETFSKCRPISWELTYKNRQAPRYGYKVIKHAKNVILAALILGLFLLKKQQSGRKSLPVSTIHEERCS